MMMMMMLMMMGECISWAVRRLDMPTVTTVDQVESDSNNAIVMYFGRICLSAPHWPCKVAMPCAAATCWHWCMYPAVVPAGKSPRALFCDPVQLGPARAVAPRILSRAR
jgi:hypothetical protein